MHRIALDFCVETPSETWKHCAGMDKLSRFEQSHWAEKTETEKQAVWGSGNFPDRVLEERKVNKEGAPEICIRLFSSLLLNIQICMWASPELGEQRSDSCATTSLTTHDSVDPPKGNGFVVVLDESGTKGAPDCPAKLKNELWKCQDKLQISSERWPSLLKRRKWILILNDVTFTKTSVLPQTTRYKKRRKM